MGPAYHVSMTPIRPFRTSLYLSLALAILSVGVSSGDLLGEIPLLTGFGLFLLGAAYALEGRFELSLKDANIVGLFLAVVLGLWIIFQLVRPPTGLGETIPWPARGIVYMGPVLMLLIPAKLLRPKHVGDYWTMQGLGLLTVAVACAVASDGVFVVVFVAYAVTFVWSLVTFHLFRELGPQLAATRTVAPGKWQAVRPALAWAAVAGLVAVPLFWLTPRSGSRWELGINARGRGVVGVGDGPVDLNRTGTLDVTREKAFEVVARDVNGQPYLDLSPNQRWRVSHRLVYDGGRWRSESSGGLGTLDRAATATGVSPSLDPDRIGHFGPDTLFLYITVNSGVLKAPPLADQVAWRPGDKVPVVSRLPEGGYKPWVHRHDGTFDGTFMPDLGDAKIVQTWMPPASQNEGPTVRIKVGTTENMSRPPRGLGRLKEYTDALIARMAADGTLPKGVLTDLDPVTRGRAPKHHEAIARALERHLAGSGEFTYTLDLARQDKALDPVEDFVINTKAGHCQRFATALAVMLRSQHIPAQFVIGYRGCEGRGDGTYEVREDHAHAWVETLVPVPGAVPEFLPQPNGVPIEYVRMKWLTLDPTPGGGADEDVGGASLLGQARQRWEAVLRSLLLAYNKESREETVEAVRAWVVDGNGANYLVVSGLAVIGLLAGRRWWRTRRAARPRHPDYFARLLNALARRGHVWPPGQTAREYAAAAAAVLPPAVADLPARVVGAYYADRFGERPPTADERAQLDAALRQLEAV